MRILWVIMMTAFVLHLTSHHVTAQARYQVTINEAWKFHKGDLKHAALESLNDSNWTTTNLPHTWNTSDHMDEEPGYYRGPGWYRKTLRWDSLYQNRRIFLYFEAANQVTQVYVNGKKVGKPHIGGYTSFARDITPFLKAGTNNLLAVRVDNSHNPDIIPLDADFTFYGGIYRDVYLIATRAVHFDMLNMGSKGLFISTPEIDSNRARIKIRGTIVNQQDHPSTITLHHRLIDDDENRVASLQKKIRLDAGQTYRFKDTSLSINNPRLWSPSNPNLYTMVSTIEDESGRAIDRVQNPMGFRWFRFDAKTGFHLNGNPLKLIGSNRHQDFPDYGNALSDEMHRYDMNRLKDMGINFLRISHYPHDPAVIEMCDRLGFIAIEEIPFINEITMTDRFMENSKQMLREMIRRDYNHPSIVAWNTSNETSIRLDREKRERSPEKYQQYKEQLRDDLAELNRVAKEEDPTRYTMAVHCCGLERNVELDLHQADIIGYNQYWGWYTGEMEEVAGFFKDFREQDPEHPFILSEYGAGADPRIHSYQPRRFDFSVEYQTLLHQAHYRAIQDDPHITGSAIWNFADFMVEYRGDAVPHVNSKGVTTLDRRPKNAYYFYKTVLSEEPYLVLPSRLWDKRSGRPDSAGLTHSTQPVEAYANVQQAELFQNNKSLGVKTFKHHKAVWQVPFNDGSNLLELRAVEDGKVIKDHLTIDFLMQPYHMKDTSFPFKEIAINVGAHFYFIDETKNDYLWVPDKPYEKGSWGYTGGKMYLRDFEEVVGSNRNILGTGIDPIYQTQRFGLEGYRFDLPDGRYEVTLHFSELLSGWLLERYLEEEEEGVTQDKYRRVFRVMANNKALLTDLDIAGHYGTNRAVVKEFIIDVKDGQGLQLDFKASHSVPVVNGIQVRRIYP